MKIIIIFLAFSTFLFAQTPVRILCSTYPMYVFTLNVTQDVPVEVNLLLPPDLGCPHNYSLIPRDMHKIARADILIINGLGLEEFIATAVKKGNPKLDVLDTSAGIFPEQGLVQQHSCGNSCEHSHNSNHIEEYPVSTQHNPISVGHLGINPHIFTSPRLAILQIKNIANGLAEKNPIYAQQYQQNADKYCQELEKLLIEMQEVAKNIKYRKVVTHHNIWDYFAQDMGLEVVGVVMHFEGKEPVAAQMLAIIQKIRQTQAKIIFAEPQYSSRVPERIARETGITLATLDPMVTGPEKPVQNHYQNIMRENLAILKKVLGYAKQ